MPEAPAPSSDAAPNSSAPNSAPPSAPSSAPADPAVVATSGAEEPSEGAAGASASDGVVQLGAALQALQARYDELLVRVLTLVEERRALDQALMIERFKAAGLERDLRVFQREWNEARARLETIESRNEHHKQLALKLQRQLIAARAERELHAQQAQRTEQEIQQMRRSRVWQISQTYRKLARQAKRR